MPLRLDQFHFYDPDAATKRTRRDLPHWEQNNVCAFVTFRLADALPAAVKAPWLAERREWLSGYGIDPGQPNWRDLLRELPPEILEVYQKQFTRRLHDLLDAGHGACVLRDPAVRQMVSDSLQHWEGERCLLAGWVIMPNHVHLLTQALPGFSLLDLCQSWKLWTARRINQKLGLKGHLWQGESWDHLLRRQEYLRAFRNYLRLNPVTAKLPPEDYSLWLPDIAGLEDQTG